MQPLQPKKKELELPPGWIKTSKGYAYERVISEAHMTEDIIKKVLRAHLVAHHGTASVFTYTKNVSELAEMEEKARIMKGRLQSFVVSDPAFVSIVNSLHDIRHKIREHKKNLQAEVYDELLLEDYYRGDAFDEEALQQWQKEFMEKVISEVSRLSALHSNKPVMPVQPQKKEEIAAS